MFTLHNGRMLSCIENALLYSVRSQLDCRAIYYFRCSRELGIRSSQFAVGEANFLLAELLACKYYCELAEQVGPQVAHVSSQHPS